MPKIWGLLLTKFTHGTDLTKLIEILVIVNTFFFPPFRRDELTRLKNRIGSNWKDSLSLDQIHAGHRSPFSRHQVTHMNETSRGVAGRGCGDPPIGGYPPSITPTSSGSGGTPTSSVATTSTTSSEDPGLPSLSATLGSEFESFGESLNLTRLLAGDTGSWDFSDPLSNGTNSSNPANQGSYRPWEIDIPATSSSLLTLSTMSRGPPNVLAPPSTTSSLLSRPHISTGHHGPSVQHQYATYYQSHHLQGHHQAHLIDQRLPSFQSQFQDPTHHQVAAHYPLVPPPVQAREIPNIQQQFLDERHIQTSAWPHTHFTAARLHQMADHNHGSNNSPRAKKSQPPQQQQQQPQHHGQHHSQHHHQTDLTLLGDSQRPSSVSSLNSSPSLTQVRTTETLQVDSLGGSPGLVVMVEAHVPKVVGSNHGTVYRMDIFHIYLL